MDIKNLAVVITGGGSGMGAETARHMAKAGAKVALLDVNLDNAKKVADEVGGIAIACDVTDEASATAALDTAEKAHGVARILINCAGIAPRARIVGKDGPHDLGLFNKTIGVNLVGSFNMLRLAASRMSAADALNDDGERGLVINTASVAAYEGQIGQAAYSARKRPCVG